MNFLDPNDFGFLKTIKDNFDIILADYHNISAKNCPWGDPTLYSGGWDVIGLKYEDNDIQENKALVPRMCNIFDSLPVKIYTYGFSILRSGCIINPHRGEITKILRSHFCLYTNPKASLTVNGESRNWTVGDFLVFDDCVEHSACNLGETDRVVVLFDFYR